MPTAAIVAFFLDDQDWGFVGATIFLNARYAPTMRVNARWAPTVSADARYDPTIRLDAREIS